MTVTKISKPVAKTVRLGTDRYAATLTVTTSGSVMPTAYGATGVFASITNADLTNDGKIEGGYGAAATPGGIGVHLGAGGTIANSGTIAGGNGDQEGGIGVDLAHGGTLGNSGRIYGGDIEYRNGTRAGAGVILGGALTNTGNIVGGTVNVESPEIGGAGVDVTSAAQITNDGTIAGGYAPDGIAGNGLVMRDGGTLVNDGHIVGGGAYVYRQGAGTAGIGVDLVFGGTLQNEGVIGGGYTRTGLYFGGEGGTGLSAASAHVQNSGLIYGGRDTLGGGGTGAILQGAILSNTGTLDGGAGYRPGIGLLATAGSAVTNTGTIAAGISIAIYAGASHPPGLSHAPYLSPTQGAGVDLVAGSTFLNAGAVFGSDGANTFGYDSFEGGNGTSGIDLSGAATAVNHGEIIGGTGGISTYYGYGAIAGNGGGGATLTTGAILTNAGTIAAGAGGSADNARAFGYGGNGGVGVFIDGGTLIDMGTVSGAAGGSGVTQAGTNGDAVQFGSNAGTLEITRTADFNGPVAANASVNDVLVLEGRGEGVMIGFGMADFTGFTTLDDDSGWELRGTGTLSASGTLNVDALLNVTGRFRDAGAANVQGTLEATDAGTLLLAALNLEGQGTLSVSRQAELVVGANLADAEAGMIVLDAGQSIAVAGTIGDAQALGIIDDATLNLLYFQQTLTLLSPTTGTGTINVGGGTMLTLLSSLDGPSVVFGSGSGAALINAGTGSITSTLTGFAGSDSIDERQLTVTSVSFEAGTLTLLDGKSSVGSLFLAGSYTTASFALTPDGFGGTYIYLGGNDFDASHAVHGGAETIIASHDSPGGGMPDHNLGANVLAMLSHNGRPI